MKKNDLEARKVSEELGINFDEAVELFSEETLNSMKMAKVVGGTGDEDINDLNLGYCNDCNCIPANIGNYL